MKSLFAAQSEIINLKHKLHKQFWYFESCGFVVFKAIYSIMKKSQTAPLNFSFKEPDFFLSYFKREFFRLSKGLSNIGCFSLFFSLVLVSDLFFFFVKPLNADLVYESFKWGVYIYSNRQIKSLDTLWLAACCKKKNIIHSHFFSWKRFQFVLLLFTAASSKMVSLKGWLWKSNS